VMAFLSRDCFLLVPRPHKARALPNFRAGDQLSNPTLRDGTRRQSAEMPTHAPKFGAAPCCFASHSGEEPEMQIKGCYVHPKLISFRRADLRNACRSNGVRIRSCEIMRSSQSVDLGSVFERFLQHATPLVA